MRSTATPKRPHRHVHGTRRMAVRVMKSSPAVCRPCASDVPPGGRLVRVIHPPNGQGREVAVPDRRGKVPIDVKELAPTEALAVPADTLTPLSHRRQAIRTGALVARIGRRATSSPCPPARAMRPIYVDRLAACNRACTAGATSRPGCSRHRRAGAKKPGNSSSETIRCRLFMAARATTPARTPATAAASTNQ